MNPTIAKFGYPASSIKEFEHWLVLARPAQVTLGSLVLAAKSNATAFGALEPAAFAELAEIVPAIERALRAFVSYDKINYLMLMMVDREVHFHVLPRYAGEREWSGIAFSDRGWPGQPELSSAITLDAAQLGRLADELAKAFAGDGMVGATGIEPVTPPV